MSFSHRSARSTAVLVTAAHAETPTQGFRKKIFYFILFCLSAFLFLGGSGPTNFHVTQTDFYPKNRPMTTDFSIVGSLWKSERKIDWSELDSTHLETYNSKERPSVPWISAMFSPVMTSTQEHL